MPFIFVCLGLVGVFILYWIYACWEDRVKQRGVSEGLSAARRELDNELRSLEQKKKGHQKNVEETERILSLKEADIEHQRQRMMEGVEFHKRIEFRKIEYARADVEKAKLIEERVAKERVVIQKLADDALAVAPYVADVVTEYIYAHDLMIADVLENKPRPAIKAAETIREYAKSKRDAEKQLRLLKYRLSVFEHFFPWVNDYDALTVSELCNIASTDNAEENIDDPVKQYISPSEYLSLTTVQRNQLALDRYLASHKKTKWEIGRDYELFVGHLFARDGYHVEYTGSLFRFDDLGRDLVVRKGKRILIVQCKYWSKEKEIHEKHIFQLFGTSICYQIDHPDCQVSCVLVTNTICSATARSFAAKMSVALKEHVELGDFPRIKCNISDSGERIYHLPMDQQYDNVVIDKPGEFFAMTVQEAVNRGFRRAYRWHGT